MKTIGLAGAAALIVGAAALAGAAPASAHATNWGAIVRHPDASISVVVNHPTEAAALQAAKEHCSVSSGSGTFAANLCAPLVTFANECASIAKYYAHGEFVPVAGRGATAAEADANAIAAAKRMSWGLANPWIVIRGCNKPAGQ